MPLGHYLGVKDADYESAPTTPAKKVAQNNEGKNPAKYVQKMNRKKRQALQAENQ